MILLDRGAVAVTVGKPRASGDDPGLGHDPVEEGG